jgi:hypothetical protein
MTHPWIEITAYHEAGHAVVALCCGWQVNEIGPSSQSRGAGALHSGPPPAGHYNITPDNLRSYWVRAVNKALIEVKIVMAGPLAEARLRRKSGLVLSGSKMVADEEITELEDTQPVELVGGPCRNRTCDHLIKSQMLYRLS